MQIIADENIPHIHDYFSVFGNVVTVNGRHMSADQVAGADVVLVRSVTPVNRSLLEGAPVKFVGTCTIGTDHLDLAYLQNAGITYASAPGCNAGGVIQYVLTALSQLRENWMSLKFGIVGCGNVGGRLYRTLRSLGVNCVGYDPLLLSSSELQLVDFDEVLQADVLCLHAPLTRESAFPSYHMFDQAVLARLKPGSLLLNAGRGGVIDNTALLALLEAGADLEVVLDVWEHEPAINAQLARAVTIGTPHIAGYSDEGRVNGSIMICRALAEFVGWDERRISGHLAAIHQKIGGEGAKVQPRSLKHALELTYNIHADHQRLMAAVDGSGPLGAAFDHLRKHYPERHEPLYYRIDSSIDAKLLSQLQTLGFRSSGDQP